MSKVKKVISILLFLSVLWLVYNPLRLYFSNKNQVFVENTTKSSIFKVVTNSSTGTGFIVKYNDNKYVITAAHVCKTDSFTVSKNYMHLVVYLDPVYDLCIMEADNDSTYLILDTNVSINTEITSISFPNNVNFPIINHGIVLNKNAIAYYTDLGLYGFCPKNSILNIYTNQCYTVLNTYETTVKVDFGSSGSPILVKNTINVLGMVSSKNSNNNSFMVSSYYIIKVLNKIQNNKEGF